MYFNNFKLAVAGAMIYFFASITLSALDNYEKKGKIDFADAISRWHTKYGLVLFFIVAYIGAGIDYGRRGIDDLRAIHIMFIVGWPVFLIAILMLFPNKNKEDN